MCITLYSGKKLKWKLLFIKFLLSFVLHYNFRISKDKIQYYFFLHLYSLVLWDSIQKVSSYFQQNWKICSNFSVVMTFLIWELRLSVEGKLGRRFFEVPGPLPLSYLHNRKTNCQFIVILIFLYFIPKYSFFHILQYLVVHQSLTGSLSKGSYTSAAKILSVPSVPKG